MGRTESAWTHLVECSRKISDALLFAPEDPAGVAHQLKIEPGQIPLYGDWRSLYAPVRVYCERLRRMLISALSRMSSDFQAQARDDLVAQRLRDLLDRTIEDLQGGREATVAVLRAEWDDLVELMEMGTTRSVLQTSANQTDGQKPTPSAEQRKKRWTKDSADRVLDQFIQDRRPRYEELLRKWQAGNKVAIRKGKALFGRKALSRKLDIPETTISRTPTYMEKIQQFLGNKAAGRRVRPSRKAVDGMATKRSDRDDDGVFEGIRTQRAADA